MAQGKIYALNQTLNITKENEKHAARVEQAVKNLMRLVNQAYARKQLDDLWGKGITKQTIDELCKLLDITYP